MLNGVVYQFLLQVNQVFINTLLHIQIASICAWWSHKEYFSLKYAIHSNPLIHVYK